MSENKRLIAVGAVIVAVIAIIFAISFWPEKDTTFACNINADKDYAKLGVVNYKQYECLIEEKGKTALVVADKMTAKKKEALNNTAKNIGHVLYYIDTKNISSKDLKTIKKDLKYNDSSFKKDVIIVLDGGEVDTYKEDILTNEDELKTFLTDAKLAKFACNAKASEEYENLGQLTYEDYNCLYESDEAFAMIISQTTCGYCAQFKPFINEYVGTHNLPLYFIEFDTLSDEEREALLASLSYFDDNEEWGTPLTLGIKNKEVIAELNGFTDDEEEVGEFFKEVGLTK